MISANPSFVYVTYIAASPQNVWKALTDGELTAKYFFGRRFEGDLRKGGAWRLVMEDGAIDTKGKILECDPPRKLRLTWHVEHLEEFRKLPPTNVDFEIEPFDETTRLTMREYPDDAIPEKYLEGGRQGWPTVLSGLKTLLETGRELNVPMPQPPNN